MRFSMDSLRCLSNLFFSLSYTWPDTDVPQIKTITKHTVLRPESEFSGFRRRETHKHTYTLTPDD